MDDEALEGPRDDIRLTTIAFLSRRCVRIVQNRAAAQHPGRANIPLQTVADHADGRRIDAQGLEHLAERSGIRLADTDLAFDLDMVEARREIEAFDLGALQRAGAIGEKRQPVSCLA